MSSILMPLWSCWTQKILDGSKPFEFRTRLPRDFSAGDSVYLYESGKNGGRKAVVGQFEVEEIIKLANDEGAYPFFGCYHFIDWYLRNVEGNEQAADRFVECKKYNLPDHKWGCLLPFAMDPEAMAHIANGKWPPPMSTKRDFATQLMLERCDSWLGDIGFYRDNDESYWAYAIKVKNPTAYDMPLPLSAFVRPETGEPILCAPQSWMYARPADAVDFLTEITPASPLL